MALLKVKCPECNAGLKSATGFTIGQTVCCPKCETYFAVEEPSDVEGEDEPKSAKGKTTPTGKKPMKAAVADDDEDSKPRKKKRSADDEEDEDEGKRSYKNSPLRFVILGILIVVMLVLAYFLYEKRKRESESAKSSGDPDNSQPVQPIVGPNKGGPNPNPNPKFPNPKFPNPKLPKDGKKGPDVGGIAVDAVGGLLGGGAPNSPAEAQALTQKYKTALVGSWSADLGNGVTEELTYTGNGTYTAKLAGPTPATASGKYSVTTLAGTRGLKLELTTMTGTRKVTAVFEDEELQHPSLQPGVTATFRKK